MPHGDKRRLQKEQYGWGWVLDLSALLARYGSFLNVFPTTIPVCRITASGALRCTPGSVANPLNRQGRFIAACSCKTVKLKSVGILAGVTWHPCHRFDGVRADVACLPCRSWQHPCRLHRALLAGLRQRICMYAYTVNAQMHLFLSNKCIGALGALLAKGLMPFYRRKKAR